MDTRDVVDIVSKRRYRARHDPGRGLGFLPFVKGRVFKPRLTLIPDGGLKFVRDPH